VPAAVTVWATVDVPGFHRWPAATGARAYLASTHRHLFRVTAHAAVAHDDRDTEFHDLAALIRRWWGEGERECGDASCETLARALADWLAAAGVPVTATEVSEDGQCGAVYTIPEGP
jgi:hypothetical protein